MVNPFCLETSTKKGIVLVEDLIGYNRLEYVVNTLNIRTICLQYNSLISSIKRSLRQYNIIIQSKGLDTTTPQPFIINFLTSFMRGCRKSYDILICFCFV